MGWYFWPDKQTEWPSVTNLCFRCKEVILPGDKFYMLSEPKPAWGYTVVHFVCELKFHDEQKENL